MSIRSSAQTDREQVVHFNRTVRAWSSTLREHARNARQRSEVERDRTTTARRRSEAISSASSAIRLELGHGLLPLGSGPAEDTLADSYVSVAELVDILVSHHGMDYMDAHLSLAVDMELAAVPTRGTAMSAPDAMDVIQRVLRRRRG